MLTEDAKNAADSVYNLFDTAEMFKFTENPENEKNRTVTDNNEASNLYRNYNFMQNTALNEYYEGDAVKSISDINNDMRRTVFDSLMNMSEQDSHIRMDIIDKQKSLYSSAGFYENNAGKVKDAETLTYYMKKTLSEKTEKAEKEYISYYDALMSDKERVYYNFSGKDRRTRNVYDKYENTKQGLIQDPIKNAAYAGRSAAAEDKREIIPRFLDRYLTENYLSEHSKEVYAAARECEKTLASKQNVIENSFTNIQKAGDSNTILSDKGDVFKNISESLSNEEMSEEQKNAVFNSVSEGSSGKNITYDIKLELGGITNNLNYETDIEEFTDKFTDRLEAALYSAAEGLHTY